MLRGKVAVVTGSTSGIGLGIASDLMVFPCSPSADQTRAQAYAVDGGWTAQ